MKDNHYHIVKKDYDDWYLGDPWQKDGYCHRCEFDMLKMDDVLYWTPFDLKQPVHTN